MARITFQKRQKEMKRMEKRRMKDERRAQRKLEKNAEIEPPEQMEGARTEAEAPEAVEPDAQRS